MRSINRTTTLLERSGKRRKIEIAIKRLYYPDHDTKELVPIDTNPQVAKWSGHRDYKFEVMKHDLLLGFAPSERSLPFMRITDPKTGGAWALWLKGFGKNIATTGIAPLLYDHYNSGMHWRLDADTDLRLDVMGHKIRKTIVLDRRPEWNSITFIIARGGASLIDGLAVGKPQRVLMAFRKGAGLGFDTPLFWFEKPSAHDSSGDGLLTMPKQLKVDYNIVPIRAGVWELQINLDPDEFDSAKYPVYIDPTLVLQPDAAEGYDNLQLRSPRPTYNCGADPGPYAGNWLGTWDRGSNKARHLIAFTGLSVIPNGSAIILATQRYVPWYTIYNGFREIYIHRILRDWGEGDKTFAPATTGESSWNSWSVPNNWTTAGADGAGTDRTDPADDTTTGLTPNANPLEFSVINAVQAIVNGAANYGWRVSTEENPSDPGGNNITGYYSSDDITPANRPQLTVEYEEGGGEIKPTMLKPGLPSPGKLKGGLGI